MFEVGQDVRCEDIIAFLFHAQQFFYCFARNKECSGYCINLLYLFSLPLGSATLFLCCCIFSCTITLHVTKNIGNSKTLNGNTNVKILVQFYAVMLNLSESNSGCCFFFQNWIMFMHLVNWKQYATNWDNKLAFLLCHKQRIQSKWCIWKEWNCNPLGNKYSIQSSSLVGTSAKWKRQCVLYQHACCCGNSAEMNVVNIFSFILTGNIWSRSLRWEKWLHCHWWHPGSELPLW